MTITVTPQTEEKLKQIASREGRDVTALAGDLLADLVEATERDFEEACAAIATSLAGDPMQDIGLEDYKAQFVIARE